MANDEQKPKSQPSRTLQGSAGERHLTGPDLPIHVVASSGSPTAPDPYIGTVVAERYRVLEKLGEGGMGVVYLAEHVVIEKRVALKILSDDFARKAELVARFMQEAKAASKIGHENIIDITDFGRTASGSVFFVMEYLQGRDLSQVIKNDGPMSAARARVIVTQICRALLAAHQKGIIHRDLKPENIYITERDGRQDFVKILDFGIAKMSSFEEGVRLTRTGMIFGTPEYMSPEQARGDRPDHRVDIYATGCILYELLTKTVPFGAETFMGILTKHMFEAVTPPAQRAPAAAIPSDLQTVVMRALAKDREHRFQSMKEMELALEQCNLNDPLAAIAEVDGALLVDEPPRRSMRRSVWGAAAGSIAILAAIGFLVSKPPRQKPTAARLQPMPAAALTPPPAPPTTTLPPAPSRPVKRSLAIVSHPSEAEVLLAGVRLGTTPLRIDVDDSKAPQSLLLRKRGFREQKSEVVANRDQSLTVDLLPLLKRPTPRVTPPSNAAVSGSAPTPPAPSERYRDLKNPF